LSRQGPASIIRTRFREDIRQEVVEKLVPQAFRARADQEDWKVVGNPNVTDIHFHDNEPIRFKAEFEVLPEFSLGEYRGLEVPYDEPAVTEDDIAKRLESIREQKADYVNIDPRPVVDGDYAVVSLKSVGRIDGTDGAAGSDASCRRRGDHRRIHGSPSRHDPAGRRGRCRSDLIPTSTPPSAWPGKPSNSTWC
jgi:FKBP-type peptidyl-prolyl cis-trans isomerase (trigger factor)